MRLYSSAALLGIMLLAMLQTGPGGCTIGTVDPHKALKVTVTVAHKGDSSATLKIVATNVSDSVLNLHFKTSQRFDLLALQKDTTPPRLLWRWSFREKFAQSVGTEELKPGAALSYDAELPYEGLPPTKYEIFAFIYHDPRPTKSAESVDLDLTDKKVGGNYKHIAGEIGIDDQKTPVQVWIQALNGVKYNLSNFPDVFYDANNFPVEAWLSGDGPTYQVADYVWVMAPLAENGQIFLPNNIFYSKSGGIIGLHGGLKIYSDGSFMASCCRADEHVTSGYAGAFEPLLQFLTAQNITELHTQYGKPGKVADGFNEYLAVKNQKYFKGVSVYQDPDDPPPDNFRKVVQHLADTVKIDGL
ncbi:hypothetical protein HYR54_03140 [Candidatus Acetothermia bacterium]|nr:hypothetical protein [Candidatus Acetothermia bacterium]